MKLLSYEEYDTGQNMHSKHRKIYSKNVLGS